MSWSRRTLLVGAAAAVAACGFTPVYGPQGAARGLRGQIAVDPPRDPEGYVLVRQLEDRLGRGSGGAAYRLSADIALAEDGLGITPDQEITRRRLRANLAYRLTHTESGDVVASGTLRNFTSYSAPVFSANRGTIAGNTVSVRAAEQDARERLMTLLADQLVARLLATAPEWRR
ncbi:twin-arginine translocation signal domain-containing protein [Rhodobacteraceae bacterium CCMM004]|nr:twin-arginine translocation signal domain-containing protein [Rhodobacteraceae bacterium CCMM004]